MAKKPKVKTNIKKAIRIVGLINLGRKLDISYQAVTGWGDRNKMPAREYSGESLYAAKIQHLTDGEVTVEDLLGFVPEPQARELERLRKRA